MRAKQVLATLVVAVVAGCAGTPGSDKRDKVVYHVNEGMAQASSGLRNINNHLEVNPEARTASPTA